MSCKEALFEKLQQVGLRPVMMEDGAIGVGVIGENCSQIPVTITFLEDQYHSVYFFVPRFIRVWSKSAIGSALCNTCNKEYVGVKFTMEGEDYISAQLESVLGSDLDGELAFHLFQQLVSVVDDAYEYIDEHM